MPTFSVMLIISLLAAIFGSSMGAFAGETVTDTDQARVKRQVESLQNSKIQAGQQANKLTTDAAKRKQAEIDKQHESDRAYVRKKTEEWGYVIGPDAAKHVGAARERELAAQAAAEKQKIAKHAEEKAARQQAAARKQAEGVKASVEGLKSQVSKDGKYGLKQKNSNLYVRHYGQ
jgi:hypothetical protein